MCTGPGHVEAPTWLLDRLQEGELGFDGWQEEWWFHKGRLGLAVEDVVGGRQ